jgi:hypothetical protein
MSREEGGRERRGKRAEGRKRREEKGENEEEEEEGKRTYIGKTKRADPSPESRKRGVLCPNPNEPTISREVQERETREEGGRTTDAFGTVDLHRTVNHFADHLGNDRL